MASLKPKPYFQSNSPSTASLLTPYSQTSGSQGVQAAFAQTPRSASASDVALVSPYFYLCGLFFVSFTGKPRTTLVTRPEHQCRRRYQTRYLRVFYAHDVNVKQSRISSPSRPTQTNGARTCPSTTPNPMIIFTTLTLGEIAKTTKVAIYSLTEV